MMTMKGLFCLLFYFMKGPKNIFLTSIMDLQNFLFDFIKKKFHASQWFVDCNPNVQSNKKKKKKKIV